MSDLTTFYEPSSNSLCNIDAHTDNKGLSQFPVLKNFQYFSSNIPQYPQAAANTIPASLSMPDINKYIYIP